MNILKHSVFAIGLVAFFAAGCTPMSMPEGSGGEIVFAQRGLLTVTNTTKASEVTSLSSFNVSAVTVSGDDDVAVWTNQPFSLVPASDPATYAGGKFWPSANPSYRFYASNAELAFGASGTTVSVTTDTDIVCAYMTDATYGTKNTLSFGHVFARLGVVTVSTDDKYDVSDITVSLVNIKTGGTYNLRTGAGNVAGTGWSGLSPSGTSATQVYRYAGTILPNGSQAGVDNDLWLVPGQYVLKATWTAHVNDYTQTFTDIEAEPVTIVAGKKSAVSCTLIGDEIRVTVTPVDVIGWSTGTATERTGWNSGADLENPDWGTGGNLEGIAFPSFWTFGGLMISPAPLYYDSSIGYVIKDNDWEHHSYGTIYGKNDGSYYHYFTDLGKFFDSRGTAFDEYSGDIDNRGQKVSYGGYDDWRLPTMEELKIVFSVSPRYREGSTVNGQRNVIYKAIIIEDHPWLAYDTTTGILVFPDGETIVGGALPYDGGNSLNSITFDELNSYISKGCVFFPSSENINASGWEYYPSKHYLHYMLASANPDDYTKMYKLSADIGLAYVNIDHVQSGKLTNWFLTRLFRRDYDYVPHPFPIGKFTINAQGDQVGFARGNLQCTIASGTTDSYNYVGTDWRFAAYQWDYLGDTDGANSFTVGKKMDLFGWVGNSASYDTYGLCSLTSTNNAYYGTSSYDELKTDWGDIPGVISACGDGWFTLSNADWGYVFNTRTTGNTINGTPDARYTEATIRTNVFGVNGIILFPDDYSAGTPSGVSWGTINAAYGWDTQCTAAGWASLEAAGCVFIPAAGYRSGGGVYYVGDCGYYWSSSPVDVNYARFVHFLSGRVYPQYSKNSTREIGHSVRLAKRVN